MRILILGAGGVGGYFGARLVQAGADVSFLVRPERAAALAAGGLAVTSSLGDFHCHPKALTRVAEPFDLVILACKAYDLDSAVPAIAPAVGPATAVLPLLNGVAHLDELDRVFGRGRVLGGVAHLSVTRQGTGSILHLNGHHRLIAGRRGAGSEAILDRLAGLLGQTGVDCRISAAIEDELWEKYVFLSTLAGATSALRGSIGTILKNAAGGHLIKGLLAECVAVAGAEGHAPNPARLAVYRTQLLEPGSTLKSSLLRDIEAGRRTEGGHILGDMVRRGRRRGIHTPLLALCCARVEAADLAYA